MTNDAPDSSEAGRLAEAGPATRIRNTNVVGGAALVMVGALALWSARGLSDAGDFGIGVATLPRGLAIALIIAGVVVAGIGLLARGTPLPGIPWRGPLFVTAALVSFALSLQSLGLFVASYICFLLSCMGSSETRWREAVIAGLVVSLFCVLIFSYALGLPFPLWPKLVR